MPLFPKSARILKKKDFDAFYGASQSKGNRYFVIRSMAKEKRRLGIVISKKVAKAYKRNLIKRIIREAFRLSPDDFPKGDILVIAKPVAGNLKREEIRRCLSDCLKK